MMMMMMMMIIIIMMMIVIIILICFNNIFRKWRSGAQNNPTVGQQPNPYRIEPPLWPAVSTSHEPLPQPRDKQNKIRKHKHGQQSHGKTYSGIL